jgi:uncharacterized protein YggE
MNPKPIELAKDPDLRGAVAALRRAEARAKQIAQQTGTRLINVPAPSVSKDGHHPQEKAGSQTDA